MMKLNYMKHTMRRVAEFSQVNPRRWREAKAAAWSAPYCSRSARSAWRPSRSQLSRRRCRSAVLAGVLSGLLWRAGFWGHFPGEQGAVSYRAGPAERGAEVAPWAVGFGLLPWRVSESAERRRRDRC